jgi:4-hydroxy-4-methyl-2-oxoglutarate aldolase
LEGVIVDGYIRDTDVLESMRFPVWSTLIGPSSPEKKGHGTVNAPVACGDIQVEPGDLIVADGDGVIVIPRERASEVVAQASRRMQREERLAAAILAGEHPWHFIGAVDQYTQLNVEEVEGPWTP